MGLREWIIPQEKQFFKLLIDESTLLVESSKKLNEFFSGSNTVSVADLKKLERDCDLVVNDIFRKLSKSFITPFDHEDITSLALLMDDVVDANYDAVKRATLYELAAHPQEMKAMSSTIVTASNEIHESVKKLNAFDFKEIEHFSKKITSLKDEAHDSLNTGVVKLFKENNVVEIIKKREVYDDLNTSIEKCQDVSLIIGDIALKHG